MLAGCIPVFVGPPYHNMPLSKYVDYKAASIVLDVKEMAEIAESSAILDKPDENSSAGSMFDWRWWISSPEIKDSAVHLKLDDVIGYLIVRV